MPNFYNSVKTFFRFYESKYLQSKYSNVCDDMNHREYLIMYKMFLPFQIVRPYDAGAITHTIGLRCLDGSDAGSNLPADLTWMNDITDSLKVEVNGEDFDFISYIPSTTYDIPAGIYYMWLSDGTSTWYSEIFQMLDDADLAREKDFCIPAFWTDYTHTSESDDDMQELAAGKLT
jgi:hypothetical protein